MSNSRGGCCRYNISQRIRKPQDVMQEEFVTEKEHIQEISANEQTESTRTKNINRSSREEQLVTTAGHPTFELSQHLD